MLVGNFRRHACTNPLPRWACWSVRVNRYSQAVIPPQNPEEVENGDTADEKLSKGGQRKGRMSELLEKMTEETIEQGGRAARRAVEEAGFPEDLKKQLESRILDSNFRGKNPTAFAQLDLPSSAGAGTRDIASAEAWTGSEKLEDAALRMLNDAHKPLRRTGPPKIPQPKSPSNSVDLRVKKAPQRSAGERLANARDRTSRYALSQDPNLTESERDQMRKVLKERFTAGARPMPTSVQGLASLANERIEDAIARGQFKNIPRGKGKNTERDHNADSPFLDTTEYFMNKLIQKQDIVPPWIEKQQELVKAANTFRGRLRNDWKRHAARVIASRGGSLEDQIRRAEAYADAENALNPKKEKREALSEVDGEGTLSQVMIKETPTPDPHTPEDIKITVTETLADASNPDVSQGHEPSQVAQSAETAASSTPVDQKTARVEQKLSVAPFRDEAWLALESSYHNLAIRELNNLARSYNLQAPDLAKKPYFALGRELNACYADVAPQLPNEIRERARRPERIRVEVVGHRPGGVLEKFSTDKVKVYDSKKPNYGFRDFWRDLWSKQDQGIRP